ncbi:putative transporter [Lasiodiplodia theobromae]|uniref:Putative transporter n=1 Tax=Lasiodiplodia theobromae TaxID=45133 RepID=A0A5N5CZV7_9PEZI|nr:putative transporter [Lasiodiplodia theobromae]
MIVPTAFYIPVAGLWMGSAPLFKLLGQDTQVSDDSARFLTAFIPGGLGYIYYESLKKYLQAQGLVKPATCINCVSALLNAALNYVLVHTFHLGLLGAPLATGLAFWASFLLLLLYIRHHHLSAATCWGGWSRRSLSARPLAAFARLAALGVLHVGSEWWAFEAVALAAGRLPGTAALAAQSVLMTSDQVFNTIPFGVGVAASARVGNLLGRGDGRAAATAARAAAGLSVAFGLALLAALLAAKDGYARVFGADDEAVAWLVARVIPYVAAFQVADGLNASCGGVLRGTGKQHVGAVVNFFAYYCFALPFGVYLAFYRRWGLDGLWIGLCCALYTAGAVQWIIISRTKWDDEVRKTRDRLDRAAQEGVSSQV